MSSVKQCLTPAQVADKSCHHDTYTLPGWGQWRGRHQGGYIVVHVEALLADPHRRSLTPEVATASRKYSSPEDLRRPDSVRT